jgi:ABC-2 type transport system permease protein/oleandomycin transport system permease protein
MLGVARDKVAAALQAFAAAQSSLPGLQAALAAGRAFSERDLVELGRVRSALAEAAAALGLDPERTTLAELKVRLASLEKEAALRRVLSRLARASGPAVAGAELAKLAAEAARLAAAPSWSPEEESRARILASLVELADAASTNGDDERILALDAQLRQSLGPEAAPVVLAAARGRVVLPAYPAAAGRQSSQVPSPPASPPAPPSSAAPATTAGPTAPPGAAAPGSPPAPASSIAPPGPARPTAPTRPAAQPLAAGPVSTAAPPRPATPPSTDRQRSAASGAVKETAPLTGRETSVAPGPRTSVTTTLPRPRPQAPPRPQARPASLATTISDILAVTRRNLIRYIRVPTLLVFSTIQPVMFVLLFRYVFGTAIRPPRGFPFPYVDYLMPGIFIQTVIFGSTQTGVGLAEDLSKGMIDRFRSLPMARSAVLAGRTLSDTVRNAFVVLLMGIVGYLVGFRIHNGVQDALGGVVLALAFGLCFSWISALIGLAVRDVESAQAASFVWLFPLVFASTAFVPADALPGWLQAWAKINPVSVSVDALRGALQGWPSTTYHLASALAWMAAILIVFVPLSVRTYRRTV